MQLRNQKDTVELTVEELKREVYPDNLDVPYRGCSSWRVCLGQSGREVEKRRGVEDQGHA